MKKNIWSKLFDLSNYLFLSILSISFIYPFWRIGAISLNDGLDASRGGINFWPRVFTLDNYKVIFARSDIADAYIITIARTVIGTLAAVFLTALMAYGLSKNQVRGRKIINIMLIITMFFSGGLIPTYLLYIKLGILNKFLVFVIPTLYSAGNVFIMRSFFRSISHEIEESAIMDGANDLVVFFNIILPLSKPIIATISLFVAVGHWNDYMTGVLFITNQKLVPLQTLLVKIITENDSSKMLQQGVINLTGQSARHVTAQSVKMATLVTVVLPIMCIYPFLQKYFVKGVMIGSLKG